MAATTFLMPWRPVQDTGGQVVPYAKLYFTNEGGDVKQPIYTDFTMTIEHPNPIVADAIGKIPPVYLDENISYRLRIYAKNATVGISSPIEEYDPYDGAFEGGPPATQIINLATEGFAVGDAENSAADIEALIDATENGAILLFPFSEGSDRFKLDRPIIPPKPIIAAGYGAAKGQSGGTGRTHIVAPAGFPAFILTPVAQQSRIEDLKVSQASNLATTGTASYAATPPYTAITNCTLLDVQNNQTIRLEGAGGSMILVGRTAAMSSGSNSVTVNPVGDFGNYYFYPGQMVTIAGAGAAGAALTGYVGTLGTTGDFALVTAAGAALNASTNVTTAQITAFAPMVARVVSGGGTAALTVDTYGYAPIAVTDAKISHCAPAIYSTTQCHARSVEVGSDAQAGVILAGRTTGGEVVDQCSFYDCLFAGAFAGVMLQGNDAQVNSFFACDFAGGQVGVLDNGLLGNYYYGCHWAFNNGFQFYNNFCQIYGGYVESNTGWTAAGGWFDYTMGLANGGGLKGFRPLGSTVEAPPLKAVGSVWASGDPSGGDASLKVTGGPNSFNTIFEGTGVVHFENNASGGNYLRFNGNAASGYYINCATSIFYNVTTANDHQFRVNDTVEATIDAAGLNLAAGNAYKVAGTQVVGAQGAAVADATDAASTQARLNDLLARLRAHGLIAT